jgi:osmoprotectant transport system permease protein
MFGFLGDVASFFADGANWQGEEGIPTLFREHVQLTVVSVLAAMVVAVPIAIVLGHKRTGGTVAIYVFNIGRALPALALLILAVQWFGVGDPTGVLTPVHSVPAFAAMFVLAIPPILANTYVGVAEVDDDMREAARGMGMSGAQMLQRVEVPIAMPLIMAGVRTAAVAVIATATLAAYVDAGGFGRYIVDGFRVQDSVKVFAGAVLVAVLAVGAEVTLAWAERRLSSPGLRAATGRPARRRRRDRVESRPAH